MKNIWKKYREFLHRGPRFIRILKHLLVVVLVLIIITTITAEITSRPTFCPTCHYMQTFYDSWKSSKHSNISCVKCHFEPGIAGTVRGKMEGLVQVVKYLSQAYRKSKPWAEITDESCLQSGCHDTRLLKGDVLYKNVVFNHSVHLTDLRRNKKLRCTSCHSQIVQGDHMTVTSSTCFLCHFKKTEFTSPDEYNKISNCKNCHRWDLMTNEELSKFRYNHTEVIKKNIDCIKCHNKVVIGSGSVPKEQCYSCHWERYRLEKYNDLNFVHKTHIAEHRIECNRCHLVIEHKIDKLVSNTSPECNTCHPNLHSGQTNLYIGHGGKNVEDFPSPMYKSGLNCAGCHYFHGTLKGKDATTYANAKSCEICHGKGYDKLLNRWKEISNKKIKELSSVFNIAKGEINRSKSMKKDTALKVLSDAEYNINLVKIGNGVHNIEYADRLLGASYLDIKKALDLISSNYKLPVLKISSDSIPSECQNCHYGVNDISIDIYGLKFSHRIHTVQNKLKCFDCHSNSGKHGQLTKKKEECTSCHHTGESKLDCKKCHEMQTKVYTGEYNNLNKPDVMNVADVKCIDCHLKKNERIARPDKQDCLKCHDQGYENKLNDWQKQIKQDVVELKTNIEKIPRSKINENVSRVIKNANNLIDDILKDRSFGAHNYELFSVLLNDHKKIILEFVK